MSVPSDVPSLPAGLHVRAGNSMARTREGLLDGALSCIERDGLRRLTMSAVANRSGVAKATLYNHFRTKDDVVRALVAREVALVADAAEAAAATVLARDVGDVADVTDGADGTAAAAAGLARAADELAEHVALRRVAGEEPAALLPLLSPSEQAPRVDAAARLAGLLGAQPGHAVVEVALRWLASQLLDPQEQSARHAAAAVIAAAATAR